MAGSCYLITSCLCPPFHLLNIKYVKMKVKGKICKKRKKLPIIGL